MLSLAILACEEQNYAQALLFLDKAQGLCGDEEFWYQITLTKVRAVVGQRDIDAQTKVWNHCLLTMPHNYHIFPLNAFSIGLLFLAQANQIIKQGCGALKVVLEQRVNRVPEISLLITTLELR